MRLLKRLPGRRRRREGDDSVGMGVGMDAEGEGGRSSGNENTGGLGDTVGSAAGRPSAQNAGDNGRLDDDGSARSGRSGIASSSSTDRLAGLMRRFRDNSDTDGGVDSDSESESDDSDDDDVLSNLPPGYLQFLSSQRSDVDDELADIADRLRGESSDDGRSIPLLQIRLVREFVYDSGAITIARAMEDGPKPNRLVEIVLSRCHIGDEGVIHLAHAVSASCGASLKTLDLSSNNITEAGAACLANCTVVTSKEGYSWPDHNGDSCCLGSLGIETLVLSSNPILSGGALALSSALGGRRSKCGCQRKKGESGDGDARTNSSHCGDALGYCTLKNLHVSGCQLNDDDAMALGSALIPHHGDDDCGDAEAGTPSLPPTNNLKLLNLHANRISLRGMEFLYSVIHDFPPSDEAGLSGLQSLYCRSNHAVELGVVVDYGTRDYHYGHFFDQDEDERLLMKMRNYEMSVHTKTGTEPSNDDVDVEELRDLMVRKLLLKEKMMNALRVNRECALALEDVPEFRVPSDRASGATASIQERRERLLRAAAEEKINRVLEGKLRPRSISLPRRQDEYGKYLDEDDSLGLVLPRRDDVPPSPSVGKLFDGLDSNVFPEVFSWLNRRSSQDTIAVLFDILRENPDVCGLHSKGDTRKMASELLRRKKSDSSPLL